MQLDPTAVSAGVRLRTFEALGSTNAEALVQARAGERGPLWLAAREQTAGRGRRGRAWRSPRGNLYASLLLADACLPARAPELSFVAGVALHDALTALAASVEPRLRLKWPNDVLLDNAKLAGILVEGETLPTGVFAVVLGFGVNCASHPENLPYRACDLREAGIEVAPGQLLAALSRTLAARLAEWRQGENFTAIREAWLARAMGLGEPILVRAPGSEVQGRFLALDGAGRLVLGLADGGTQVVSAAEVFPIGPAPSPQLAVGETA